MQELMTDQRRSINACKLGSPSAPALQAAQVPQAADASEIMLPSGCNQGLPSASTLQTEQTCELKSPSGCKYGTGFFGGKFLPFHQGHLDCILRCASECEKLFVVLMHNGEEERRILADYSGRFPKSALSAHVREIALRAELAPFSNIQVLSYDCRPANNRAAREGKHPWFYECQDMVKLMGRFDVAYSSESEYSANFRRFYPWATPVVLDERRSRYPISATAIRNMPFYQAYGHLPREYQKLVNKKVLFTGTESCGKSTLVRKLAAVLGTSFTQEQGKLACERVGLPSPGAEQYPQFVCAQVMADTEAVRRANMVALCDTDAIVTEFYLNVLERRDGLPIAREAARLNEWDLVLFVEPTVPWVDDGLRTSPLQAQREAQARVLRQTYESLGYKLVTLDGDYRQNYERALCEIRKLLGYEDDDGKERCNEPDAENE